MFVRSAITKWYFFLIANVLLVLMISCNVNRISTNETKDQSSIELEPLALTLSYTKQFGTSSSDNVWGVATDADRNTYIVGYTRGDLQGNNKGLNDAYIRKYGSGGKILWTKQFGTSNYDYAYSVAANANGKVYVVGHTNGSLQGANKGARDAYIRKYGSGGKILWTKQFGTNNNDYAYDVTVDVNGNVYIAGHTGGSLRGTNKGLNDAYIRKYGSGGKALWTRQFGTSDYENLWSITTDIDGNVYVAGYTGGSLWGTNKGANDVYIRKYDTNGKVLLTRQFGTSDNDTAYGITVDANGNIYVAGNTWGNLQGTNKGARDAYIRKYNADGNIAWTKQFGTNAFDNVWDKAIDANGNIYVAGNTLGSLKGTNKGAADAYFRKYNTNGKVLSTRQFGTSNDDYAYGITTDINRNVHIVGQTKGALKGSNKGNFDAYTRKYTP